MTFFDTFIVWTAATLVGRFLNRQMDAVEEETVYEKAMGRQLTRIEKEQLHMERLVKRHRLNERR